MSARYPLTQTLNRTDFSFSSFHPFIRPVKESAQMAGEERRCCRGWVLVLVSYTLFMLSACAFLGGGVVTALSESAPPSSAPFLSWLAQDDYFRFLVPATLPVTLVFVYLNWMGLKLFRHNR